MPLPIVLLITAQLGAPRRCAPDDLMRHITVISADSMMGRAPGSHGDLASAAYLTRALQEAVGASGRVATQDVPLGPDGESRSRNIIATVPGTRDEWVVVTAHRDGLGVGKPDAQGDSIYNGANDNAVGAALLICATRELSSGPLRRGVIAILTAAEERGRLGSRYWAEHPTVDLTSVKFAVNLDAIGVTGPTQDFIAYGNGLLIGADSMLRAAGAHAGFELATVSFESNMYWAFDSAEMGAAGIPAVTIGMGTRRPAGTTREPPAGMPSFRERYHSPADEVAADWDPTAIRRYADLAASVVEAARTHTGEIRLKVPNAYQKRP
jgi:Zn-dependent M28 family amino/carboxypeptidase